MRVIEAFVFGVRDALAHIAGQVRPHLQRGHLPRLNATDRLDIRGDTLFDPMVFVRHRWKRQVHHFMGQHPIVVQLCDRRLVSNVNLDEAPVVPPGLPAPHAVSVEGHNAERHVGNRVAAIVGGHRLARQLHPVHQVGL